MFKTGLIALLAMSLVFAEPSTTFLGDVDSTDGDSEVVDDVTDQVLEDNDSKVDISQECLDSLLRVDSLVEDTSEWFVAAVSTEGETDEENLEHIILSYEQIEGACSGILSSEYIMDCTNDIEAVVAKLESIETQIEENPGDVSITTLDATSLSRVKSVCIYEVSFTMCENQIDAPQPAFSELYDLVQSGDTLRGEVVSVAPDALTELLEVHGACVVYEGMEGNNAFDAFATALEEAIHEIIFCMNSSAGSECKFEDLDQLYDAIVNDEYLGAFEDPIQDDTADETSTEETTTEETTTTEEVTETETEAASVDILVSQE